MRTKNNKTGAVLVVGGGIAGIQASLDLANSGFKVYLLDSAPAIGGTMAQLDKTFPTNDCAMCIMAPKLVECGRHLNVELLSCSEIEEISGGPGNFKARILKRPRYIDIDKCTGCAECEKVCPVKVTSEFDEALADRKAVFRLFPQAYPAAFVIDKKARPQCQKTCPAGVHVQGYIDLIRQGKYKEALTLEREQNPFPSVCGRVCTHPCEDKCKRGEVDEPISIRALKRFIADNETEREKIELPPQDKGKVAIIGSGPSGLSCAYDLVRQGYKTTIFEALPVIGGMLITGIPAFRLHREELRKDIDYIKDWGVEIKTNVPVNDPEKLLKNGFDAVYIATGAHLERKLGVEGEDLKGVYYGIEFLRKINLGEEVKIGEKVAVIGGGNSAVDAARTVLRLGAKEVTIVYRRSRVEMPANEEEIERTEEEGIKIQYLTLPTRIIGNNGKVTQMECIRMKLGAPDASGRRRPIPIEGSEFIIDIDTVVPTIGQTPDTSYLPKDINIKLDERWNSFVVDPETLQTTVPGIFAGGDAVTGPATVIEAIAHGHKAAISIDRFFKGENLKEGREEVTEELPSKEFPKFIKKKERQVMPVLPVEKRIKNFKEVDLGFTEEMALEEASRCLECGLCSECLECERVCEADAVLHSMTGEHVEIDVGSIILAPGADKFDPSIKYEYGYTRYPNVVTSIQFERILAPSGPYEGHIRRPSDNKAPKKIAWLQCIGSRDEETGSTYCSGVCCMYAIKEAIIAKEHAKDIKPTIFFMDIRAHGKDFDKYYEKAEREHDVRFIRSRVGKIEEIGRNRNLLVYYTKEDGKQQTEEFDLVVLSVGFKSSTQIASLADKLGIRLNMHRFFKTLRFSPVETTRLGIFVCGPASGPKDIPETVMEASGATACAAKLLADVRGTQTVEKTYPPEKDVSAEPPQIGVFICHCGINIGAVVNVPELVEFTKTLPNVVYAEENLFTCSQDTQQRIKNVIDEYKLNRIVVASCTPRTHEPLFQDTIREAGLNRYLFVMANIREHCSWVHRDIPKDATEKAKDLVKMAVAKARLVHPLEETKVEVKRKSLIIGGGLSGMTSALALAEQGFEVALVEKEEKLGGNLRNLYYTAQGEDVQGYLNSLIKKVESHPKTKVYKGATIENIEGYIGNYKTSIQYQGSSIQIEHGISVVATGAEESKPKEYLYGEDGRVISQLEFEKRLVEAEKILEIKGKKPKTDIEELKSVVMIQCVGSREDERPYCSRVCCTEAIKNALKLKELNPKVDVYVLYRDVRTYGFFEEYYRKARDNGITFIRYEKEEKPVVETSTSEHRSTGAQEHKSNGLRVKVKDPILCTRYIADAKSPLK